MIISENTAAVDQHNCPILSKYKYMLQIVVFVFHSNLCSFYCMFVSLPGCPQSMLPLATKNIAPLKCHNLWV